jgi:hypothetical protein
MFKLFLTEMVLQRIKQYIDYKNISIARFEAAIGMSNNSFRKSLANNGSIGSDKLENILKTFPEISSEWLLTGQGDMLKSVRSLPLQSGQQQYVVLLKKYADLQEKHVMLHEKYELALERL